MAIEMSERVMTAETTGMHEPPDTATAGSALTILYGSQTGNAEFLASQIMDQAKAQGYNAALVSLDAMSPAEAVRQERLLIVTSTHDNGHMPDNAQPFWESLQSLDAPIFQGVPFAVLAIGDSMYEDFCKAGVDLDRRIAELGGERIVDRVDCDVDYDFTAGPWIDKTLAALKSVRNEAPAGQEEEISSPAPAAAMPNKTSRQLPDTARVVEARRLSAPGSAKEVWHYELEVDGDSAHYRPGDSLAVVPTNPPRLVNEVLDHLGCDGDEIFEGQTKPLRALLSEDYELRLPHFGLVAALAQGLDASHPVRQLVESADRKELENWLWGKDLADVLRAAEGPAMKAREIVALLRPIQHRAYSISSSPRRDPDRIHLTVSSVRYEMEDRQHVGACSGFLSDAVRTNAALQVFPLPAHEFHLPEDANADVIMIGPGVGVAPFRAFLREREATNAQGRNWLFFGDQHREPSWLYQEEIEAQHHQGLLDRLSLAFSRDQEMKIYVQDRMRHEGADLFSWISGGAHIYVCGDKRRMAPDIDRALVDILQLHGGMTEDAAVRCVQQLKDEGRYVKDVY